MKCNQLIEFLEQIAPLSMAEAWDNVGLLVGTHTRDIKRVYIALDATDEVIEAAISNQADFLLTHHPLIFNPIKSMTGDDFIGRRIIKLIKADMVYYAMHTNFDVSVMADLAAEYLKLTNLEILEKTDETHGIGKVGCLPNEMTVNDLCQYVKEVFTIESVKVFGDCNAKIKRVAVLPGSGKSYIQNTIQSQADVMITGDIGHHEGIDAVAQGLIIIDAWHYGIEHIFVKYMQDYFNSRIDEIEVFAEEISSPFRIL